jgi:trigger factor
MPGPPKKPSASPSVRGRPQRAGAPSEKSSRADARTVSLEAGRVLQRALDTAPAAQLASKAAAPSKATAERALAAAANIRFSVEARSVSSELVHARIDELRRLISITEPRAFGQAVAAGDEIEIDLIGYVDGKVFLAQEAAWFDVRPNPFLPGFFEALVGVVPPDNVVLRLQLPASYPVEEHRNKPAAFAVSVRRAQQRFVPDADDPVFLQLSHRNAKTRRELEEKIEAELVEERARLCVDEAKYTFLRKLYVAIGLDDAVPEDLVDDELRTRWKTRLGDSMALHGVSVEEQRRSLVEFSTERQRAEARRAVWESRCLEAVATLQGIEVDDDEVPKLFHSFSLPIRASDVDNVLYENAPLAKDIGKSLRLHRALLALMAKATISFTETASFGPVLSPLQRTASQQATDVTAARGLKRPSGR